MEENYQNNLENIVEDVNEEINVSETKIVKKEIVINKRYVKFYLKCLLFSFLTVIILALLSIKIDSCTADEAYHYTYTYNDKYELSMHEDNSYMGENNYYIHYEIQTMFNNEYIYIANYNGPKGFYDSDNNHWGHQYRVNKINIVLFFIIYLFVGVPLYWYLIISLAYIPILWFIKKYKFKFK